MSGIDAEFEAAQNTRASKAERQAFFISLAVTAAIFTLAGGFDHLDKPIDYLAGAMSFTFASIFTFSLLHMLLINAEYEGEAKSQVML